jgi:hypothetical protein
VMAIDGEPAQMPEKELPVFLRTVTAGQSTGCITAEEWSHLADCLPPGLFTVPDCLSLKELYLLLERFVLDISPLQKLFQFADLSFVATRHFEFGDLLLVDVPCVPASSKSVLFITQVFQRKTGSIELLSERSSERPLQELEVSEAIGDYRRVASSVNGLWIAFQRCTPTILEVVGLCLAPHVQFLAAGLGVSGNVIVVHHDPLGGRNQPLIRSGVSILLPKSTELMVQSSESRRLVGGRAR